MSEPATQTEAPSAPAPAVIESTPAPAVETTKTNDITKTTEFDNDLKAIWSKNNPERDGNGRFVAAEKPTTETATEITTSPGEPGAEQAEPPAIEFPNSWVADTRELWTTIPRAAQEIIAKRESEAHEAISRAGQERKAFEPIQQTLEQFWDVYERNGLAPHDAMARMFAVEQWLASDPRSAIRGIAEAYQVDLSQIGTAEAQLQSDPRIQALSGEVSQLKSILTTQQRKTQETERAETARTLADFAKDKPHYEAVRTVMAGLLQSGAANDLTQAYDMATRANPETWKKLQEETQKKEQEKAAKEASDRAAKAKRDAGVNVRSSLANQSESRTMDDDLRAIAAKHYGRTRGV